MTGHQFLEKLAEQLASELTANNSIRDFTRNPELIGAYAEATVRRLITRIVSPLRVSRGSIVYEGICPDSVPEIDAIIWTPCPMPAVFEIDDFGLIPRMSAFAFLEIKRSNYPRVGEKIKSVLEREDELVPLDQGESILYGTGVQTPMKHRSLGVVCLREHHGSDKSLNLLVAAERAVVLLEQDRRGGLKANPKAMFNLVNFLMQVRYRAGRLDGSIIVNWRDPENVQ